MQRCVPPCQVASGSPGPRSGYRSLRSVTGPSPSSRPDSVSLTLIPPGPSLAAPPPVDRGVIATALELFAARHYPGVVAVCTDALDDEPECIPLLLFRARANVALRHDLEAQADLLDVIRLDPRSTAAYRLLGELAARNDENAAAAQFFREALRLYQIGRPHV